MIKDKWKKIRLSAFGSVDPEVSLISISSPVGEFVKEDPRGKTECLPSLAASTSYNSKIDSIAKAVSLNKKLIKDGHHTPLEVVQYHFFVKNISKACSAQASRTRIGSGHVSLSRRYTTQNKSFCYPRLNYIEDEATARHIYQTMSDANRSALYSYNNLIDNDIKKGDARLVMPTCVATSRSWWLNARSLRYFLNLRLGSAAEEEIRILAYLLLEIAYTETPSLFEDIYVKNTL
jgi:flavin-dependent thymidylate synthase